MTDPSPSYRARSEGISWRTVGEEIVILDLGTSQYLTLNATGAFLWERLTEGAMSLDDLVGSLLEEFDVDESDAAVDVQEFLASCEGLNLISTV